MFQQRHFEAIALMMQDLATKQRGKSHRERTLAALCQLFKASNPRFNEARFRAACMPGANVRKRSA